MRFQERRWLYMITPVVLFGLFLTYRAERLPFDNIEQQLTEQKIVNLSTVRDTAALAVVFSKVYPDPADHNLVAVHVLTVLDSLRLAEGSSWRLPNTGWLNTDRFDIPERLIVQQGGVQLRERLARQRSEISTDDSLALSLPLFESGVDLARIKPDLIVRTPRDFRSSFWLWSGLYCGVFIVLHLLWCRRRFRGNPVLLIIVYLITGLSLMLMFSIPDPLRDVMRGRDFASGFVIYGAPLLFFASQIDFQRWKEARHYWAALGGAAVLVLALYFFGFGPGGSDAHVNLRLPLLGVVQPIEGVKLLAVLFLAGYMGHHWDLVRAGADGAGVRNLTSILPRLRYVLPVAAGVALVLAGFFSVRDMGPGLLFGCVFLMLYGIVRNRWIAVSVGLATIVLGFWIIYIMDLIPTVGARIEMRLDPWDNFRGGEQLAHAFWAMSTGGLTGQGIGLGSPASIPASYTDMILAVLGEELGLMGMVCALLLFFLLCYQGLRIALSASGSFSFFLALGITLLFFVQLFLIAGGVLGILPLTGVVTPFMSYGKTSMMTNSVLLGMLLGISARPGSLDMMRELRARFKRPLRVLGWVMLGVFGFLTLRVVYIQFLRADALSIRPALVMRSDGKRTYVYNPRILQARDRYLPRGSIFDRGGVPLATSDSLLLRDHQTTYEALGVDVTSLPESASRYYPFRELTFYLLSKWPRSVGGKWGAGNSLYAEWRYLSDLRGYDNYPVSDSVAVALDAEGNLVWEPRVQYNYKDLLPLVRYGPTHPKSWLRTRRNRDVYLTVDISLQHRVAEVLQKQVPAGKTASAVVLEVSTGAVLASVTWPLPEKAFTAPAAFDADPDQFDRGFEAALPPGSTFKLATAIAALAKDPTLQNWDCTYTNNPRVRDACDPATYRYARRGAPTGRLTMARAIEASSNVYFASLSNGEAGADVMLKTLRMFGFSVGRDTSWSAQRAQLTRFNNLRQAGFGQGPLQGGPLQVAHIAATIANDGVLPSVHWVQSEASNAAGQRVLPAELAQDLGGYMRAVVTGSEGTGRSLRRLSVPVAGKSGTAEQDGRRDHAWFVAYAPYAPNAPSDVRKIAVAVVVEEGGGGGRAAAPIVGEIIEQAAELGFLSSSNGD